MTVATFALAWQADWRCGRSGACCTAGWPIPVEAEVADGLGAGLRRGRLRPPGGRDEARLLERRADLGHGLVALLGRDEQGACRLFDRAGGRACALHRDLGHEALPVACRLFPRVCLLEPHGVSVSLSHFCPTVADRLFDDTAPEGIVADAPSFPPEAHYEGLDARAALPPLLRPDALLGWEGQRTFERHAVAALLGERGPVEATLLRLAARAESARAWRVERGPLDEWLARALEGPADPGPAPAWAGTAPHALLAHVRASLVSPAGELGDGLHGQAAAPPGWEGFERPLRRFLAGHAFAAWVVHQGRGLRTRVLALLTVLAVARASAARACARVRQGLDPGRLREALRETDLLLRHLSAPDELARRLSAVEEARA